jgi:hypothetical protein
MAKENPKGDPMPRSTVITALAALAILTVPAISLAQSEGGNSAKLPATSGTNSAGTAQSSGSGVNTAPGVTTGAAGTGTMATNPASTDAAIAEENRTIDRRLKSICRGC